ncbi:MAG: hypothetical protein IJ760_03360 [Bacteroidales bacterium]|nr:hypothetical protein [Bacteroidales bacterium]
MKRPYLRPRLEAYSYLPERGYEGSRVALHKDYVLIEGNDGTTLRSPENYVEYIEDGEFTTGEWDF